MHEKEIDSIPQNAISNSLMTRSVMESVSENLLMNLSIRIRTLEGRIDSSRESCSLRDSLQLQHSTNLNIQRSQSTQRFNTNNLNSSIISDTNRDDEDFDDIRLDNNDSNYLEETNIDHGGGSSGGGGGQDSIENNEEILVDEFQSIVSIPSSNLSLPLNNLNQNALQEDNMTSIESSRQNVTDNSLDASDYDSIPGGIENKDCEYMKLVSKFKKTLVLPDAFFASDLPCCYCETCTKGGRIYPIKGWVRFKLNHQSTAFASAHTSSDSGDWTTAFYLTRADKVRSILDHGQPLPIGMFIIYEINLLSLK